MARIRGNAAITWTDTDDTMTERLLILREPLREIRAAHSQSIYPRDSLDMTQRVTFTVGIGADELVARVRFQDDPQGVIDLIKAGSKQRTLSYQPDMTDPDDSYAVLLISPLSPTALTMDADHGAEYGDQEVTLRFRRTTQKPFAGVWTKDELFSFRGGGRIQEGTFVRAGTATYIDKGQGIVKTAQSGVARLNYVDLDGDGFREEAALLLERRRTNLVKRSRNFGSTSSTPKSSAWTLTTLTKTSGQVAPWSSASNAYLLTDSSTTVAGVARINWAANASTNAAFSCYVKQGSSAASGSKLVVDTTGGTAKITGVLTWSSGQPSVAWSPGVQTQSPKRFQNGYWRVFARTTGTLVSGTTYRVGIFPAGTVAEKGSLYVTGIQVEVSS